VIDDAACSVPGTRLKFRSRRHQLGSLALPLLLIPAVVLLLASSLSNELRLPWTAKEGLKSGNTGGKTRCSCNLGLRFGSHCQHFHYCPHFGSKKGGRGVGYMGGGAWPCSWVQLIGEHFSTLLTKVPMRQQTKHFSSVFLHFQASDERQPSEPFPFLFPDKHF